MKNIEIILRQYAKQQGTIVRGTSDLSPLEEWLLSRIVKSTKDSAAEILEKHLLGGSYTDEEINKNLDLLSAMQEFAESYASQQMPSEELIKEQYKETVCRIKNYTKCPYYNDFREGCLDCKYHRLT